ncbi:bifunctional indole-3-glycerol-phosphate synthase TrpC/phosphoribosylanthranilate isomerase TrpF [Pasteurella oralis]|uniref:bifunctional indole-3-glycerol-phosphate synthase TrpC/phosphoribosylanthranilate isomerase TrpF n=1 Tax=Pasteurella oralis TaxID=1071947 RepID=UPI000C7AFEDD|nr:bifunctional indole-3-glycerol-phosphate synthase TrpC/phosphoribosylanthranilate isomerase TrpF [Pasteurella oralis]
MQNTPTILQKIIQDKRQWVADKQALLPLSQLQQNLTKTDRSFYHAIQQGSKQSPAYILECKKASPSKGLIRADFNLAAIADVYKQYASVISVLTDEKYFQGNFTHLQQVRARVRQPVLCKDFIISTYQVYLARYHQADAILLMLSVIDDDTYRTLADLAHQLGMGILTETSNEAEFERALTLNAKVIGVNNRNLHDLSIDLNRVMALSLKYADKIPAGCKIISESGIYNHQQICQLSHAADGFLIGSSLMGEADLNHAVRAILFGENKVCGLTRSQDVIEAYQQGALYGGLIFAEQSKRCVSLHQAQELVTQAPLRFVGVFQNQAVDFICKMASQLTLYAVQLHGNETTEFITTLRQQLSPSCQIWQAISVDVTTQSAAQIEENLHVDRYVFDSKTAQQQGGTGMSFDWTRLPTHLKAKIMLAGGINPNNIKQALAQGCLGIDLNSGIEHTAGMKSAEKMSAVFSQIRQFCYD